MPWVLGLKSEHMRMASGSFFLIYFAITLRNETDSRLLAIDRKSRAASVNINWSQ